MALDGLVAGRGVGVGVGGDVGGLRRSVALDHLCLLHERHDLHVGGDDGGAVGVLVGGSRGGTAAAAADGDDDADDEKNAANSNANDGTHGERAVAAAQTVVARVALRAAQSTAAHWVRARAGTVQRAANTVVRRNASSRAALRTSTIGAAGVRRTVAARKGTKGAVVTIARQLGRATQRNETPRSVQSLALHHAIFLSSEDSLQRRSCQQNQGQTSAQVSFKGHGGRECGKNARKVNTLRILCLLRLLDPP